jgi:hypothetical protein
MHPALRDIAGPGILFWLIGYLAGIVLFFTPFKNSMGWILLVVFTPFTLAVTWWWFSKRGHLSLQYYAGVGVAWMLIAVVLDYIFIVMLFGTTTYYATHVLLYYALMVLIPVAVGVYLGRAGTGVSAGSRT